MKKAKAYDLVRAPMKEYPSRLVMNADMPYKVYAQLKAKHLVAKNRQDFTTFDAQWNKFKVLDISVDPDKIFTMSIAIVALIRCFRAYKSNC